MKTKHLEILERYFNSEMSVQEKAEFERSLASDPDLKKSFESYKQILEALGDGEVLDLRLKLREIHEEELRSGRRRRFLEEGNNWIWLAALLIVIICFTVVASLFIEQQRVRQLYIASIKPERTDNIQELNKELVKYGLRNEEFTLELPSENSIVNYRDTLCFRWRVNGSFSLVLELINGMGQVVYRSGRPVQSPHIIKQDLPDGFYIFRFRSDQEAFRQGAIFLRKTVEQTR